MTAPAQVDAVSLTGVTVAFPRRAAPVLRDVDLRLAPGEQVVLLGPSGCGKSTVLHAVSGVVPHTVHAEVRGEVRVGGTATQDTTVVDRSRDLGVVAQDPSAGVCLPVVEQELALPLENHAVEPAAIDGRIDEALEAVGAGHLRHRATGALSGGESQRVALAAALVTAPDVLLLDEPTSMLDGDGVAAVRVALRRGVHRSRPAVVLVEHRLDEWTGPLGSAALPSRAVVLDAHGRLVADGPTQDVLRRHARALHRAGCWLPLDTELRALTGADGGLGHRDNVTLLDTLAARGDEDQPRAGMPCTDPVLAARDLAVARPGPRRSRGAPEPAPLLSGLDLEVRPGEVVGVLGANGVGKSTLLLTLAGCLPPRSGTVEGPRPGMVFQNAEHQFVASSTRAEIAHGLPPGPAADLVVERGLRDHRLEHLADQNPFRLSGGEKRRLSLAAMLAHERPVLLADEPTLGLDRRDAIDTAAALRRVADRGGAVVLSSHDLRLVASLCTRVLVLGEGGVLLDAPTAQALADDTALTSARLALPSLVSWLVRHHPSRTGAVLRGLDLTLGGAPR